MFEVQKLDASGHYSDGSYSHWDWMGSGTVAGREWSGLARVQWSGDLGMFELRRNDWVGYWPRLWRAYQHVDGNGVVLRCYLDLNKRNDAFARSVKDLVGHDFNDLAALLCGISDISAGHKHVPDDVKKVVLKQCSDASNYLISGRREN